MAAAGTVLVVDDQAPSREAMADALRPLGYEVLHARDGREGMQVARERLPDVILLDIVMPGLDGYEVCQQLKADEETRLIPVVFLTGLDSRQARLRGLEVGATDFLSKPFDLVELEVRVRNLVSFRHLTQDLDSAEQILFAVARAVEARDEQTGDHCGRLADLAAALGESLRLDRESIKALGRAGYLHDIGKIGIPDGILLKPGRLTDEEWVVMRSHVEIGVSICSPLRTLRAVLPIIRYHHERQDGSGYPEGLAGNSIPFLAQVFQVVDVFDALTNDRPYRKALSAEAGLQVLRDEAARGWWNTGVVDALTMLVATSPSTGG